MAAWRLPIALLAAASACLIVAFLHRDVYPPVVVGGRELETYASGWTAYAPIEEADLTPSRFAHFDLWDPYLWVGAGATLLIVAFCVAVRSRPRRQHA